MRALKSTERSKSWKDAYRELQLGIIMGHFRPRERLVEDDIIARTGVTRHAVRRAFDELTRIGIVIRQPNKGVQVRDYTVDEIEDLYEIRECLEVRAALRFTQPASTEFVTQLTELATLHRRAVRGRGFADVFTANNAFHEALYRGAGNQQLADAIHYYTFVCHPIRTRSFPTAKQREIYVAEHFEMVAAVAKGDGEQLGSIIRRHLHRPKEHYIKGTFISE